MKAFVESYPQFKKLSGTVSKHVAVMGELSTIVKQCNLLEISELEQDICAKSDHSKHLLAVKQVLSRTSTTEIDGLRLALLYALKYERNSSKELQVMYLLRTDQRALSHILCVYFSYSFIRHKPISITGLLNKNLTQIRVDSG